jgi:hypothetical protein
MSRTVGPVQGRELKWLLGAAAAFVCLVSLRALLPEGLPLHMQRAIAFALAETACILLVVSWIAGDRMPARLGIAIGIVAAIGVALGAYGAWL